MTLHIQPIADYTNVEHCLGVAPTFVHPRTGNIYSVSCEKKSIGQDVVIRRMPPNLPARWEEIRRYRGGIDAMGAFGMGGAIISRHGVLVTTFICQPREHPLYKPDGFPKFQSCWDYEGGIDEPYLTDPTVDELRAEMNVLREQNTALQQQVAELQTALGNQQAATLAPEDVAALAWVKRETKALG